MSPILMTALIIAALAVLAFAIHRAFPAVTLKSVEADAKAEAAKLKADLPDLEADAAAAGQKFLAWLTDTTAEVAAKAKADASIAKKNALRAQTISALNMPPSA